LAPLAGYGSLGDRDVRIFGTSSSSIHGHGMCNSFDEGLASAISTNFSPTASPSRRVISSLPNGLPTTQIRHRGHDPRALVDVWRKVVKELGRLGRGIPSKAGERNGSIGVVREPDYLPLRRICWSLTKQIRYFPWTNESLFAVTASYEPRRSTRDIATILPLTELPLASSRPSPMLTLGSRDLSLGYKASTSNNIK